MFIVNFIVVYREYDKYGYTNTPLVNPWQILYGGCCSSSFSREDERATYITPQVSGGLADSGGAGNRTQVLVFGYGDRVFPVLTSLGPQILAESLRPLIP